MSSILTGSPRKNGNCAFAADLVREEWGKGRLFSVAQCPVSPCLSCGYCAQHPGQCSVSLGKNVLDRTNLESVSLCRTGLDRTCLDRTSLDRTSLLSRTDSQDMYEEILHAFLEESSCLISPIYFYHLPAQLKAFVDRSQAFFDLPEEEKPGKGKKAGIILLGARERGEKLFEGSLLTLKYMGISLGLHFFEPLLLYGLDSPDALRRKPEVQERVRAYARQLKPDPGAVFF